MIIKKAKYKKVKVMQTRMVSPEVYGCDECKIEIKDYPNEDTRLEVSVFKDESSSSDLFHFCSWECVFKFVPKIKSKYFATLPYLQYDSVNDKKNHKGFIKALKGAKLT